MGDIERYERPLGEMVLASEHDEVVAKLKADLAEALESVPLDALKVEEKLREENAALREAMDLAAECAEVAENGGDMQDVASILREALKRASAEEGGDE